MPKTVVKKFRFSELKFEKVKLFTQSSKKFYCISVFKQLGCLNIKRKRSKRCFIKIGDKKEILVRNKLKFSQFVTFKEL